MIAGVQRPVIYVLVHLWTSFLHGATTIGATTRGSRVIKGVFSLSIIHKGTIRMNNTAPAAVFLAAFFSRVCCAAATISAHQRPIGNMSYYVCTHLGTQTLTQAGGLARHNRASTCRAPLLPAHAVQGGSSEYEIL